MSDKYRLKKDCIFANAVIKKNSILTAEPPDSVRAYLKSVKFSFSFKLRLEKEYILGMFRDKVLRWVLKKDLSKVTKQLV